MGLGVGVGGGEGDGVKLTVGAADTHVLEVVTVVLGPALEATPVK